MKASLKKHDDQAFKALKNVSANEGLENRYASFIKKTLFLLVAWPKPYRVLSYMLADSFYHPKKAPEGPLLSYFTVIKFIFKARV